MRRSADSHFGEHLTKLEHLATTRGQLEFGPAGANNPVLMQAVAYNIKCLSYYVTSRISNYVDRLAHLSVAFENPCGTNNRFLTSEITAEFDAIFEAQVNDRADELERYEPHHYLPGWSALQMMIPAPYQRAQKQIEWIITAGLKREETHAKNKADVRCVLELCECR